MDWTGISILIIGIVFLGLVVLLLKPLKKLVAMLSNLQHTTDEIPRQMADTFSKTKDTLISGKNTVSQVNQQISSLTPIVQIMGRMGLAINGLFTTMAEINDEMKAKTDNPVMERYHLEGIYGLMALGYCLFRRKKRHL